MGVAAPPETQPSPEPEVLRILADLEKAGEKYPTVQADIDYRVDMVQTGDTEDRTGSVAHQRERGEDPAKFRVRFDTLKQGDGPKIKDEVDYAFDGLWLTVMKFRIKEMTRYQVAAPGQKAQPLKIGKGPFPVPFGQKAAEVLKLLSVTTRPVKDGEPKDSDYLRLVPRPEAAKDLNFVVLEMWVDRKTGLPVRIVSADKSKNVTTVTFRNIQTGKDLDAKVFSPAQPAGWTCRVERFGEK